MAGRRVTVTTDGGVVGRSSVGRRPAGTTDGGVVERRLTGTTDGGVVGRRAFRARPVKRSALLQFLVNPPVGKKSLLTVYNYYKISTVNSKYINSNRVPIMICILTCTSPESCLCHTLCVSTGDSCHTVEHAAVVALPSHNLNRSDYWRPC